jgi:diguanylate cyclase (GGDEF)-like protein
LSDPGTLLPDHQARRATAQRALVLGGALLAVSLVVFFTDMLYLWPLFIGPLLIAAVYFFELGSLLVAGWLGCFFIAYFSLRHEPDLATMRQALVGLAMFGVAGLMLGRFQRNQHTLRTLLAASSLTDRLTGLYNYGTFADYLHIECTKADRYGGPLALVMLDVDHFKRFNDRHGHEVGNDLLRRIGATLQSMLREADMAARYGGEEFALLIRGDGRDAYELAERVRRAIETIAVDLRSGDRVYATISAGVATYPNGSTDETLLIEQADEALYESKARGRNRVTLHADAHIDDLSTTLTA